MPPHALLLLTCTKYIIARNCCLPPYTCFLHAAPSRRLSVLLSFPEGWPLYRRAPVPAAKRRVIVLPSLLRRSFPLGQSVRIASRIRLPAQYTIPGGRCLFSGRNTRGAIIPPLNGQFNIMSAISSGCRSSFGMRITTSTGWRYEFNTRRPRWPPDTVNNKAFQVRHIRCVRCRQLAREYDAKRQFTTSRTP